MKTANTKEPEKMDEEKLKVAYYPGCTLRGTTKEYADSFELCCKEIGIELIEIPGWVCCGATSAHTTDKMLSLALPLHNLIKVEQEMDVEIMTAPCAACHLRSKVSHHEYMNDSSVKKELDKVTGKKYKGTVRIRHPIEILSKEFEKDKWEKKIKKKLKGLKVACYYGCLLTRPEEVMQFDEKPECPTTMDNLMKILGANPVDWNLKVSCCGASYSASRPDVAIKLTNDILADAKKNGAECMVVACPLCHTNLDLRQVDIEKTFHTEYKMPVFYFSELMGLTLGLDPKKLGLNTHFVDTKGLLEKKGLL